MVIFIPIFRKKADGGDGDNKEDDLFQCYSISSHIFEMNASSRLKSIRFLDNV